MKRVLLSSLYRFGLLTVYHRVRNRRALTVIALHRVLSTSDPRWMTCDPLYTLSERFFGQCLDFLARHYSFVSLAELERARAAGTALPPRPLLLTFDDGWADNHRYVLPMLAKRRLPAVLFVAADAIDRHEGFFQEQLIASWRAGRLDERTVRGIWMEMGRGNDAPFNVMSEPEIRALIAQLQSLGPDRRREVLAPLRRVLTDENRQMLSSTELQDLYRGGFAIGTHGKQHEPLPTVADLNLELRGSRGGVALALGVAENEIKVLSFPFSRFNATVVERARAAGYGLLFGGGLSITPLGDGIPDLIARVGITQGEVAEGNGDLRAAALAAYLFRRPHLALQTS